MSHRETSCLHVHTQCHSECSREMHPLLIQELTSRDRQRPRDEGGGGKEKERRRQGVCVCWRGGLHCVCCMLAVCLDWFRHCISLRGASTPQPKRHKDGCSVLTPVLPPDTHDTLPEQRWGYDAEERISGSIVTSLAEMYTNLEMDWLHWLLLFSQYKHRYLFWGTMKVIVAISHVLSINNLKK